MSLQKIILYFLLLAFFASCSSSKSPYKKRKSKKKDCDCPSWGLIKEEQNPQNAKTTVNSNDWLNHPFGKNFSYRNQKFGV